MVRRSEEGFILSTRPIGEADLIVTFLTAEEGKVHAVAKSARRSRRRFGAALEPLTRVRAHWSETREGSLARLESCDIVTSYVRAQRSLPVFYFFAYAAELAAEFGREREADPRFFRLLGAVLDACAAGLPVRAGRRYLDLWTLRLQGLLPDLAACAKCGLDPRRSGAGPGDPLVDIAEGALLCPACAEGAAGPDRVRLPVVALAAAAHALRKPPGECAALAEPGLDGLDGLARRSLMRFTERPMKTLRFLTEAGA